MKRPYTIISTAMSIDGRIAASSKKPIRLSNKKDFHEVDRLRAECDAILVGSTTLKNDNPRLLIKNKKFRQDRIKKGKPENPIKAAISKYCDIPSGSLFLKYGESKKYIFTTSLASKKNVERVRNFAEVFVSKNNKFDTRILASILYKKGIRKLLIEGGGSTNYEFIKNGLVDEIRVSIAPRILGYPDAPTLVDGAKFRNFVQIELKEVARFNDIAVLWYKLRQK